MKTPTLNSVQYAPGLVPSDPTQLSQFLNNELRSIAAAILRLADGHLDKSNVAPTKPRDGDLRYADGTAWNPGSGQGIYAYYGAAWHFLG